MASLPAAPGGDSSGSDESPSTIVVLAFAGARDVVGEPEITLPMANLGDGTQCKASEVMDAMIARYPDLAPKRRIIRLAVNGSYVDADAAVKGGDEVALIPPVAGG